MRDYVITDFTLGDAKQIYLSTYNIQLDLPADYEIKNAALYYSFSIQSIEKSMEFSFNEYVYRLYNGNLKLKQIYILTNILYGQRIKSMLTPICMLNLNYISLFRVL